MEKSAFTLVFVALLAATAGSAVTYGIMKRPATNEGANVAAREPRPARLPATDVPPPLAPEPPPAVAFAAAAPIPSPAPFTAAPEAPAKVRKSALRGAAPGGLATPEEFEQNYFAAAAGPGTPDELSRAATALTEQIAGTEGFLQAHPETQARLAALRQSAKALGNKAENKPAAAERIRARFDADLAALAGDPAVAGQGQALAAVIQKRAAP